MVQHKEDQALAGLDEPLGIQAKPSPCSLARTVRKSGTTPFASLLSEQQQDARYLSKRRMGEPCDESRVAGAEKPPTPERPSKWRLVAKREIDVSLELADEMEAA